MKLLEEYMLNHAFHVFSIGAADSAYLQGKFGGLRRDTDYIPGMPLSRLEIAEADLFNFLLEYKYGYVWSDATKNKLPGIIEFERIGAITALTFDLLKL